MNRRDPRAGLAGEGPARVANGHTGGGYEEPLLFERSRPGRSGFELPASDVPPIDPLAHFGADAVRTHCGDLPELSEIDVVRHFTRLSTQNYSVDLGLYPLGSCTMKYNPKINEKISGFAGFANAHPLQPAVLSQGVLELMWRLAQGLAEVSGMDAVSLQPAAGAQGELAGVMMIRAYHESRSERRTTVLVPDSAHGTNPASAALNGYEIVSVPSGVDGRLHPEAVAQAMTPDVACLMLTNPSTLGLFETHIAEIAKIVHAGGGLVYGDGANLNAMMGIARPGDLGIDVMHFNLHKSFSTPHGGGGPGSGPVGVRSMLVPHLPAPIIAKRTAADGSDEYWLDDEQPHTIGRLHGNLGNVGMGVRAYAYLRALGPEGLRRSSELAVLNANYLLARLRADWAVPYDVPVMHECILSDAKLHDVGVSTLDVAKRLIDYGYHPPTVYFPLVVAGALMIEPTESESLEGLDQFAEAMRAIAHEARTEPDLVRTAPHSTRLSRLDETRAARRPVLRWRPEEPA